MYEKSQIKSGENRKSLHKRYCNNEKTRSRRRIALFRRLAFMAIIFAVVGGLLTITYTKQVLTLKEKKKSKCKWIRKWLQ